MSARVSIQDSAPCLMDTARPLRQFRHNRFELGVNFALMTTHPCGIAGSSVKGRSSMIHPHSVRGPIARMFGRIPRNSHLGSIGSRDSKEGPKSTSFGLEG